MRQSIACKHVLVVTCSVSRLTPSPIWGRSSDRARQRAHNSDESDQTQQSKSIKFLIAYFQVDPPYGVAFLYHNYYLHGESKLHWCHQVTTRRKRHSEAGASGTREKSGISSLVEGLEYVVSALLGDTLQEKTKSQALRLESAYLLGLLVHSEMQLFALLLSHIQSVDYLAKSLFGDNVTSLLHLIGDAKACFRSSCSLIPILSFLRLYRQQLQMPCSTITRRD
jgi:hypothetical protein